MELDFMATSVRRALLCICVAVSVAAGLSIAVSACKAAPPSPLVRQVEARRVAAELRLTFTRAADASNRAVMADTDEASIAFAAEAEQAKAVVKSDADALDPLLRGLDYAEEAQTLDEFRKHFGDYDALDRNVLALAVENTNLKAQQLSFGPARDAANAFRTALDAVASAAAQKARCEVESRVAAAGAAVLAVQVLYAPHIAESHDAAMSAMEHEMDAHLAVARASLDKLSSDATPTSRAALAAAGAALERFAATHAQIIALSRKNSNVPSLALALGDKRALASACDAKLTALGDALGKREITTATR